MFWKRKKTRLELLRESVGSHAQGALESAQGVLGHASEAVQETLEHAPEKIGDLKDSAGETLSGALSRVQSAVSTVGSTLGNTAGAVKKGVQGTASHAGDEASHRLSDARHAIQQRLAKKQRRVEDEKAEVRRARTPEVVIKDGSDKWIWLGAGILLGAVIGILMAPSSGRRNRALLRDKLAQGAHKASDLGQSASRKAHDLSNRVEGVAHKVAEKVNAKVNGDSDDADDVTIADRVRTAFGRLDAAQGLERINIDSCDGVVTLRGPVVGAETQAALIAAAQKVAGVREVISDFLVEDESEETFVG